MDMRAVLERITIRQRELGISDRALGLKAGGSVGLIRNWRKAVKDGEEPGAYTSSLSGVADALQVSETWLRTGATDGISAAIEAHQRSQDKRDAAYDSAMIDLRVDPKGKTIELHAKMDADAIEGLIDQLLGVQKMLKGAVSE